MTYLVDRKLPDGTDIAAGLVPGWTVTHKFGRNLAVGSSFEPVAIGGVYLNPGPASATSLRVKAGNANDAAAGTGAREVTLQGLDETGAEVTEAVATAGASAGTGSTATFMRLYRAWVSKSGAYVDASSVGGHAADVVIENAAGGTDWLTLDATDYARGQSEVACYTVPLGSTAYIISISVTVEPSGATKPADILLVRREDILATSAPYQAPRIMHEIGKLQGTYIQTFRSPIKVNALSDIMVLAQAASGTPSVEVDLEILVSTP